MTAASQIPKHPSARARRNKVAGARTLKAVENPKVPKIPPRGGRLKWQPETIRWWHRLWMSPMSDEYDDSDYSGIVRRLYLEDAYWVAIHMGATLAAFKYAAEIRIQDAEYGLTPMARRRLQWQIDQGEKAEEKTKARRQTRAAAAKPQAVEEDPRAALG